VALVGEIRRSGGRPDCVTSASDAPLAGWAVIAVLAVGAALIAHPAARSAEKYPARAETGPGTQAVR
jgi:hypothetical protein